MTEVYEPIGYVVTDYEGTLICTSNGSDTVKLYETAGTARGAIRRADSSVSTDDEFNEKYEIHPVYL